jgi:glycosyltransferase involved in cell wall biosynthesis
MDVSVVIPVYNTEKYLPVCIDSVLAQTGVSLEIILVDDGSTDSSPCICDKYAEEHDNITTIHIKNSGPATAKNKGLLLAKGNYIALTDSDDKMEPMMLHKMVSAAYEYDADIVCCNYKQIDEQGHISHLNSTNQQYVLNHEEGLIHFFSKDKIYSQCWTKLYNRQMLTDNHIENDPGLRTDEDFIFNIRAFVHAKATIIVDEPLYIYNHRENSLARDYFKSNISQYIDNRIQRVKVTQEAVKNESDAIKHWSIVHIIMYYNELLGKVALFPQYYTDKRIKDILYAIRKNKDILKSHYILCGFSNWGRILITYLPSSIYMRYRRTKI